MYFTNWGSDQWGNIVSGVDLIRMLERKLTVWQHLLSPWLLDQNGKTEKGAVWLNDDLYSAYDYWQFWRNTDDRDVSKFLNFFTEIESEKIIELLNKEKNINKLKVLLRNETMKISW